MPLWLLPHSEKRKKHSALLGSALIHSFSMNESLQFHIIYRYKQCFDEAQQGFEDPLAKDKGLTKDDRSHGSLLVLQELLRCSNAEGERLLADLEELNLLHSQSVQDSMISTSSRVLPNGAVELINTPALFSNNFRPLPGHVAQSRMTNAASPLSIVLPQQVITLILYCVII